MGVRLGYSIVTQSLSNTGILPVLSKRASCLLEQDGGIIVSLKSKLTMERSRESTRLRN